MVDPLTGSLTTTVYTISTIADFQWHYDCFDLFSAFMNANPTTSYAAKMLKVYQVINIKILIK